MDIFGIGHDTDYFHKRSTGLTHDSEHRVAHRMFKSRADDAGALRVVEFVHEVDDCASDEMLFFLGLGLKQVETDRTIGI